MAKMYERGISYSKFVEGQGYEYENAEDNGYTGEPFAEGSDEFKEATAKCDDWSWLEDQFSEEEIKDMINGEYDILVKLYVCEKDNPFADNIPVDSIWASEYFIEHKEDYVTEEDEEDGDDEAVDKKMKPLYKVEMETETWDGKQNSGQVYYTDTGYDISTDKWDMLDWFEELGMSDRDEDDIRKDAEIYNGIDAEITYKRTVYKFVPDEDYDPETDNEDSWEIVSEDEIGYSSILKAYLS